MFKIRFFLKKKTIFFFTFSIFWGFGCPGADFRSNKLIFCRKPVLDISWLVDFIAFFSVLECPKSVFLIFPILYDISAFISRADRRNRPGGLEDLWFWNFSTAESQSIPTESQHSPLKINTNQWWPLLLRKPHFSQSSGNFRQIRDRILKALNVLFKMGITLWDSSQPFKS